MDGKINARISVEKICRVTGGLIYDEQGGFRAGRGSVDQIFTLKQIGEKAQEKKHWLYLFLCMNETMLWKEKERFRIRAVQMDNL